MEAVAVTPPTGWNRLAPKTSCGTRERTPTCRRRTDRISDGRDTYEGELVAAIGLRSALQIRYRGDGDAGGRSVARDGPAGRPARFPQWRCNCGDLDRQRDAARCGDGGPGQRSGSAGSAELSAEANRPARQPSGIVRAGAPAPRRRSAAPGAGRG